MNKRIIEAGKMYKHFKGAVYYVHAIAEHTETGEAMVVYSKSTLDTESHKRYVRPYGMFNSLVDKEKYPSATQEYRFELVEE